MLSFGQMKKTIPPPPPAPQDFLATLDQKHKNAGRQKP